MISPPSDSLSSGTETASSPSSNVELFQSTLVKVRDTMYFVTVFMKPAPGSSSTVWSGHRPRGIPPTDSASSGASAPCIPPTTPWMAMNRLPMIDSCSDWKPSDHLGIKIPRIVCRCLALYPRMNAEESGSQIRKMGRRWRCRSSDPV